MERAGMSMPRMSL